MSRGKNPQIFIAKLPVSVEEKDLDDEFRRFGPIKNIQLKRGYAFIEYEGYKDADAAIDDMDGRKFEGQRIVVQHASRNIVEINFIEGKRREYTPGRDRDNRSRSRSREHFPKRSGPLQEDICYNCGKAGHWANECREPLKPKGQYFRDESKCYKCGEKGHIERDCRSSRKRGSSRSKSRSGSRRRHKDHSRSKSSSESRRRSRSRSESSDSRDKRRKRSVSERSSSSESHRKDNHKGSDQNRNGIKPKEGAMETENIMNGNASKE